MLIALLVILAINRNNVENWLHFSSKVHTIIMRGDKSGIFRKGIISKNNPM